MFAEYLSKAMHQAEYELIEDGTYFGMIPGFPGVWGNGRTLESTREDLVDALEGWLLLKLWMHDDDIPVLGRLSLTPQRRSLRSEKPLTAAPVKNAATSTPRSRKAS
jgi:predicted RNase H-like HicB family nuclease